MQYGDQNDAGAVERAYRDLVQEISGQSCLQIRGSEFDALDSLVAST